MRGGRCKKTQGGSKSYGEAKDTLRDGDSDGASMKRSTEQSEENELTMAKAIQNLSDNIREMRKEIKEDLNNLKAEMNQKLQDAIVDIRNHATRLTEAEQRVNELETVNVDLRDALIHCLDQQKTLQTKVTDLEGRSRRNNLRIYGIKEDAEGNDMMAFINNFIKKELALPEDEELQIQRAHRSLGPKPQDIAIARSIVVNFQRYDIKDKILRAAWAKKISYEGKTITFTHDLPTEINNKLKEYKDIKKILKEQKIRFQTPYPAKMRIHWESGPRLYKSASEAAEDMKKRGYAVEMPRCRDVNWEQVFTRSTHWEKAEGFVDFSNNKYK